MTETRTGTYPVDPHATAMDDYLRGCYRPPFCYVRSDGKVSEDPIERRFEDPSDFRDYERRAFDKASGRVLDIGCGAGKHLLPLQRAGLEAEGIDISPQAVRICRARGGRNVQVMDALRLTYAPGTFDSVLLFSNGLSMGGTPAGVNRLLAECHRVTRPGGRVLLGNTDVALSTDPADLAYQEENVRRGDPRGLVRMRTSYAGVSSDEFDWLFVSPADLAVAAAETGWSVTDVDATAWGGYAAVLDRE
ncbi:class I SAM-dependent methyltransferase [Streptomyces sp. NPDC101234]|uniref:class I SAM-dependent methyltransferase n=1 Tax=Streptomyces sp. NPDC101234 TaxID=3366138 RepID=UPI0038185B60